LIAVIARIDRQGQVGLVMSDEPTVLKLLTRLDIPVERVINGLVEDKDDFKQILVLGFDKNNQLTSRSSTSDIGTLLELLEMFKHNLLSGKHEGA